MHPGQVGIKKHIRRSPVGNLPGRTTQDQENRTGATSQEGIYRCRDQGMPEQEERQQHETGFYSKVVPAEGCIRGIQHAGDMQQLKTGKP
jgi:hypothetical protein